MRVVLFLIILMLTNSVLAELLKPSPDLEPLDVISIQLTALKDNNKPYNNAGIDQTWEFAHPSNRIFTGPLVKFTSMMYSPSYFIILDHKKHKIILVNKRDNITYFFIELEDEEGNKYGFKWIVEKVLDEGEYKNCWMTTNVSQPMKLSQSI